MKEMSSNPGDATARPKASAAAFAVSTMPASPASAVPVSKSGPSSTPGVPLSSPRLSRAHAIGTAALGVYIVSGYANDLIYRYFGTKPYLSWISGIVLLIAFLACGSTLRSLKTTSGRLGLALGIWLLAAVPFSRWPGGSWALMESYLPRTHAIIFYSGALLLSLKHCRTIVFSMLVAASAVLFSCFQFGNLDSGRLSIR